MSYFVRAFCTSAEVPPLTTVLQWLDNRGRHVEIDRQVTEIDPTSSEWVQAALIYKPGKKPILAECNRDTGTEDCLLRKEVSEFLEFIGNPGLSTAKRNVIKHLKRTQFIICCQLPLSDMDDDGYDANGEFLTYFVENCSGMIQADGEGFFKGTTLIVKLE